MKSKKIISFLLAVSVIATGFVACSNFETVNKTDNTTTNSIITTQEDTTQPASQEVTDNSSTTAVTETTVVTTVVKENGTTKVIKKTVPVTTKKTNTTTKKGPVTTTAVPPKKVVLQKNSKASSKADGVEIKNALVKITKPGDYLFTSDVNEWHGQIIIKLKNTEKCSVRFENVNITYNKGNIIQIIDASINDSRSFLEAEASTTDINDDAIKEIAENDKAPNVDLAFPTGTKSTFTSSANNYTGIIYNESKLTIKGNGTLNLRSIRNTENCLCSTKSVTFKNVSTNMTSANNNVPDKISTGAGAAKGIFCYSKVVLESGKLNIKTNGDGIRCDKFYNQGATVTINSSACDAIDADDVIELTGGSTGCYAPEKSGFKVRRVNTGELRKDSTGKYKDYFKITAGTALGEGKKMSTPTVATQACILAKIKKNNSLPTSTDAPVGTDDENRLQTITLQNPDGSTIRKTTTRCTKVLYSKSNLKKNASYKAKSEYGTFEKAEWQNGVCNIKIRSTK